MFLTADCEWRPLALTPESLAATAARIRTDNGAELALLTTKGKDEQCRNVYYANPDDFPADPEHWKWVHGNFRRICEEGTTAIAAGPPAARCEAASPPHITNLEPPR